MNSNSPAKMKNKNRKLEITVPISELNESQIRIIKSINILIYEVLTTKSETEFFENSNDLFKACANLVKRSSFATKKELTKSEIAFGDQAIEYSIETIMQNLSEGKIISFDN